MTVEEVQYELKSNLLYRSLWYSLINIIGTHQCQGHSTLQNFQNLSSVKNSVYYLFIAILLTSFQSISERNDKIDVKHLDIAYGIEITAIYRIRLVTCRSDLLRSIRYRIFVVGHWLSNL